MTIAAKLGSSDSRETPLDCLLYWEKRQSQKVLFVQPTENGRIFYYTWSDVANQVRRMAAYLMTLDLPPRSKIAIYGKNSAHWIIADLAIWMAGHVSVPLYSTLNADGAKHVLIHSEAKLLFIGKLDGVSDSWHQVKEIIPTKLPCIRLPLAPQYKGVPQWDDLIRTVAPIETVTVPDPDEVASIVYTSGSMGLPNGILHSFKSMMAPARALNDLYAVTPADRVVSYLPLAHVAERVSVEMSALYYGLEVYFIRSRDTFISDVRRAKPTLFLAVPRVWTKFYLDIHKRVPLRAQDLLFKLPKINHFVQKQILVELGLEEVRFAFTASAPMPAKVMKWCRSIGLEMVEAYGMTENFGYSHGTRSDDTWKGDVGRPYPEVQCRIDESGEILVKSPGMMLGYHKDPVRTTNALTADGFLRTGDMGRQDRQGRLIITGRVKDLFKTAKGKYVAPVPIERMLSNHTRLKAVCVCGAGLPQPIAIALLAKKPSDQPTLLMREELENELRAFLKQTNARLEPHEKLDCIVVANEPWTIKNGLLTPTLKVKRSLIEERYASQLESWSESKRKVIWM